MLALGAALSTLFAPDANAGCGKALASKLSILVPGGQAQVQTATVAGKPNDTPESAASIVGMWRADVLIDGQVIFQSFESFTGDGLEFLNDNGSTLEGNVCFGVWTSPSKNTVKVYHLAWNYDMGGNLIGTVVIKTQIAIDPAGNTFKGTVVVDTYDLNGNVAAPELQAALRGKRITVD